MFNKSFSFILAVLLLLQSLPLTFASEKVSAFNPEKDCAEGKCVEDLVALAKLKTNMARKDGCLPKLNDKSFQAYYENKSFSVSCMKQLKEIEEINAKLMLVQKYLSGITENDGTCKDCKTIKGPAEGLLENIKDISKTNSELACTEKRKEEVWNKCGEDFACHIGGSNLAGLSLGTSVVAGLINPKSMKMGQCNLSEDSCLGQFVTMFWKSVSTFVETIFDFAWGGIKSGAKNVWQWLKGTEDKSSTAQFAALKASENEGFFQQLKKDFPGTMANVWNGLIAGIQNWFSNDVFCQEWSGKAHYSECKRPYQGLGCTSCKTFLNGICGLGGAFVSEIVPAFLTGGLFTAAKYGVKGAAKIAKAIKISPKLLEKAKATKLAKSVEVAKKSKVVVRGLAAVKKALEAIEYYFLLPVTINATTAIKTIYQLAKVAGSSVMYTKAGPVIIFGKKVLKTAGKVVIFPIDNPLFNKSFELGGKFTEGLIKKASGKATVARSASVAQSEEVDKAFVDKTIKNEDEASGKSYLTVVRQKRAGLVGDSVKARPDIKLTQIVDEYYPELNYGRTARKSGAAEVQKAEADLKNTLERLPASDEKDRLLKEFDSVIASSARAKVVNPTTTFTRQQVFKNAALSDDAKFIKGLELLGLDVKKLSPAKLKALKEAFVKTKLIGDGLFNYSYVDRKTIQNLLQDAGLSSAESELLLRSGLVGHARAEDLSPTLRRVAVPEVKNSDLAIMSSKADYQPILKEVAADRKAAVVKALKVLQDSGLSEKAVAETYKKFKPHFKSIQAKVSGKADAEPMLAEYIARQKKAGLGDGAIQKKLDETFGACK